MGHLHCPNLWFLSLYHGKVKEIEVNGELRGMLLTLLLDLLLINFPCSLLAQVLTTVQNENRCQTQFDKF